MVSSSDSRNPQIDSNSVVIEYKTVSSPELAGLDPIFTELREANNKLAEQLRAYTSLWDELRAMNDSNATIATTTEVDDKSQEEDTWQKNRS